MLGALFGTGGVLTALYVGARLDDKNELRATAAGAILINTSTRVVLFGASGLLTQDGMLTSVLILLPSLIFGLLVGSRLHTAVPTAVVFRVVYMVLALAGVSVLVRVLAT
jgi:hypothetical protein